MSQSISLFSRDSAFPVVGLKLDRWAWQKGFCVSSSTVCINLSVGVFILSLLLSVTSEIREKTDLSD